MDGHRNPMTIYLSVTVHYFDEKTQLKSAMLECTQFSDRHTAENVAQELKKIADDWAITNKIEAVTTDNAPNIKSAIRLNNWKQIACFAHTLSLIVQTALRETKQVQLKVEAIVELFRRSPLASERLKNVQQKLGNYFIYLIIHI